MLEYISLSSSTLLFELIFETFLSSEFTLSYVSQLLWPMKNISNSIISLSSNRNRSCCDFFILIISAPPPFFFPVRDKNL